MLEIDNAPVKYFNYLLFIVIRYCILFYFIFCVANTSLRPLQVVSESDIPPLPNLPNLGNIFGGGTSTTGTGGKDFNLFGRKRRSISTVYMVKMVPLR